MKKTMFGQWKKWDGREKQRSWYYLPLKWSKRNPPGMLFCIGLAMRRSLQAQQTKPLERTRWKNKGNKVHIVLTKYWHELERPIFTVASSSFFGLVLVITITIVIFIMISVSTIINDHYNFHFRRGEHRTQCCGNVAAIQPCQCENGNWPGEIVLRKYCPKTVIAWQQHAVEQLSSKKSEYTVRVCCGMKMFVHQLSKNSALMTIQSAKISLVIAFVPSQPKWKRQWWSVTLNCSISSSDSRVIRWNTFNSAACRMF